MGSDCSDADLLLAGLDVVAARLWKENFGWEAVVCRDASMVKICIY